MNDWNEMVANRIDAGATVTNVCSSSGTLCMKTVTTPIDENGTLRQLIEYSGDYYEQWLCTIDRATSNVRLCGTFFPGKWRAEKKRADGHFIVIKVGTVEEVYDALGWPH